jgi:uncharacterized protein (TIGR02147 family)
MGATLKPEPPRIFAYLDYRTYLEDYFAHRKKRDPGFSLRTFAKSPGLSLASSSFISAVIKGRKNLSQHLRLRFGMALGLDQAEMEYFQWLIQFNQSRSADEKAHFHAKLIRFHGSRARALTETQQRFYAKWYYGVVWHYFGLRQDQNNPARIGKSIFPPLRPEQVDEAIHVLLELKLIKKLANGYAVTDRHLAAGKAFRGAAAREYNKAFLQLALESLARVPAAERQFTLTSFSISPRGFARVKEKLDALRAEVREIAEADEGAESGERVFALALQLFPCSQEEGGAAAEIRPVKAGAQAVIRTSSDCGNAPE